MVVPARVKRRQGNTDDRGEGRGSRVCDVGVASLLAPQKTTSLGTDKAAHTRTTTQKG